MIYPDGELNFDALLVSCSDHQILSSKDEKEMKQEQQIRNETIMF